MVDVSRMESGLLVDGVIAVEQRASLARRAACSSSPAASPRPPEFPVRAQLIPAPRLAGVGEAERVNTVRWAGDRGRVRRRCRPRLLQCGGVLR